MGEKSLSAHPERAEPDQTKAEQSYSFKGGPLPAREMQAQQVTGMMLPEALLGHSVCTFSRCTSQHQV